MGQSLDNMMAEIVTVGDQNLIIIDALLGRNVITSGSVHALFKHAAQKHE